jgi:RNA polymerase sigma-70 factor (sigma-E family)
LRRATWRRLTRIITNVKASREAEYAEYVQGRLSWLRRTAYLLCRDWAEADDLVQVAITRLYTHWGRARDAASLDAYTRTILIRVFLNERRAAWYRRVIVGSGHPDEPAATPDHDALLDVRAALRALPPRQRATVVLRFYCDLPIEETARALGVTTGTVKSQTAKGLAALRASLEPVMES